MDQTHIHLLINLLPIFGSVLGALVLFYGARTKSEPTKIAAYLMFILSALGAGIAYLTGEAAEEAVEGLPGIMKNIIEQHEDFSLYALISFLALGVASMGAIFLNIRKSGSTQIAANVILFISLISFALVAWTGYLGGQIRHTEISGPATSIPGLNGDGAEED